MVGSKARGAKNRLAPLVVAIFIALGLVVAPQPHPVSAQPLPSDPQLLVDPDCFTGDGSWTITISGRNFDRNRQVNLADYIYYGTSGQEQDASTQVTSDDYGVFTAKLTVTAYTYYYYNHVSATYSDDTSGKELANASIGGPCTGTKAAITPPCGDGKSPSMHVTGSGWASAPADAQIQFQLYVAGGGPVGDQTTLDPRSSFDFNFSPGVDLDPGNYQLVIKQNSDDGTVENYQQLAYTVPCSSLSIKPTCAQAGSPPDRLSIQVSGSGFDPSNGSEGEGQVEIIFDPGGEPQEYFYSNSDGLPEDGSFGPLEINPYARQKGTYTIEVLQQHYGAGVVRDQTLTFNVPCFSPVVSADPSCGPPEIVGDAKQRYALTVSGSQFAPYQEVTVVFDPDFGAGSDYPPETFTTEVGQDTTFTLGIDTAYRPPGTYRILAYQDTVEGHIEASSAFTVPCTTPAPTLTLEPTCAPAADGQSAAYTLNLVGAGFAPGFVELVFDPTGTPFSGSVQADATGAFTAPLVVDGKPPGAYDLRARQTTVLGPLDEVSAQLLVPCEGIVLRITPTNGPRGFVPLVEGFGFRANATLLLRWDYGIGSSRPITIQTDANGSFTRQLLIFRDDFMGPRHLSVELPTDPLAYAAVTVPYLVVAGTVSPPFVTDNPFGPPDPIVLRR